MTFIAGTVAGTLVRRVPLRGWMAALLLILSALFWAVSEPSESAADTRTWTLPCFMFTAPIAVIYSFRARKLAPDRLLTRAVFFGSFVLGAALLFMLCGLVYALFVTMSSPNKPDGANRRQPLSLREWVGEAGVRPFTAAVAHPGRSTRQ